LTLLTFGCRGYYPRQEAGAEKFNY